MKRVSPRSLIQSRPLAVSLCISIYAKDRSSLLEGLEEAKLIASKDHESHVVGRAFSKIDEWLEPETLDRLKYPVALFASPGFAGFTNLPEIPMNLAVVATSFHIKPLLKWLQRERAFFVLSFEMTGVQLYQAGLTHMKAIERIDYDPRYTFDEFLSVVHRVTNSLGDDLSTPTILAGPKSVTDRYYTIGKSSHLLPTAITSAVDLDSTAQIHKAALELLEPYMQNFEDSLVKKYWRAQKKGLTTNSLNELVLLGLQGRIKHLFVSEKMNLWGHIDFRTGRFTYTQKQVDAFDDCILDDLSEIVIFHGGAVTVLPSERMPNNNAACAIIKTFSRDRSPEISRERRKKNRPDIRAS